MSWEKYQQRLKESVVRTAARLADSHPQVRYRIDEMTWDDVPLSCGVELFRSARGGLVEVALQVSVRSPLDEETALTSMSSAKFSYRIKLVPSSGEEEEIHEAVSLTVRTPEAIIVRRIDDFLDGFDDFIRRQAPTLERWMATL